MGEITEVMLDGILDEQTGEYIGEAVGYPRTMQSGFYNSVKKRKPKRNIKHAMKGQSCGGLHLVGKKAIIEQYGKCVIEDYVGNKRGRKRYVVVDENGNKHKVKFNCMKLCKEKK
jgi:hypothetical protein